MCKVTGALAKNPVLLGMFDNTVVEEAMQLRSGEVVGESSDNEEWEEVNVCDSRTSYILPRAARSIKGSFMFIVNQPRKEVTRAKRSSSRMGMELNAVSPDAPVVGASFNVRQFLFPLLGRIMFFRCGNITGKSASLGSNDL